MRVLYVSDVYFPRVNGVSTSIRTFRADLAAQGVATWLVAPDYDALAGLPDDDRVLRVASARVPKDPEDRRMRWGALRSRIRWVLQQGIDLVHVQTPFLAHYAGVRAASAAGVPVLATYHTFFEEYLHHYVPMLPRRWGSGVARHFTRSQCDDVAGLIAPSQPMRDALLAYDVRTPIHVLPTGLPPDRFRKGNGARFRASQGIPEEAPLLVYIGRVAHEKNIGFLLHAHRELLASRPGALLLIAGEGPALDSLRAEAGRLGLGDRVRFAGYLERDGALLDCFAAGDAFVFASRTETQGLVLLEAMAQDTPVVSTAVLGTRSILREGEGAHIAPDDVQGFAAAVDHVLAAGGRASPYAATARGYALTWSSSASAARLADLYRETIATRVSVPDLR